MSRKKSAPGPKVKTFIVYRGYATRILTAASWKAAAVQSFGTDTEKTTPLPRIVVDKDRRVIFGIMLNGVYYNRRNLPESAWKVLEAKLPEQLVTKTKQLFRRPSNGQGKNPESAAFASDALALYESHNPSMVKKAFALDDPNQDLAEALHQAMS
jgi:hypothetical protein